MVLIMLWLLITLRPLLQCMMCVATHMHVRGHTPRGWSRPVVVGYQSSVVTLMRGGSGHRSRTNGLLSVQQSLQSTATTHPQRWAFDGQFTRCGTEDCVDHCVNERQCQVIVTRWRSWEWVVWWYLPRKVTSISKRRPVLHGNHRLWRHR